MHVGEPCWLCSLVVSDLQIPRAVLPCSLFSCLYFWLLNLSVHPHAVYKGSPCGMTPHCFHRLQMPNIFMPHPQPQCLHISRRFLRHSPGVSLNPSSSPDSRVRYRNFKINYRLTDKLLKSFLPSDLYPFRQDPFLSLPKAPSRMDASSPQSQKPKAKSELRARWDSSSSHF